ncbi:MAG: glycoside hydrolase family 30 beta sandwich domain-containing protein [Lachnospiraceae bacterium]|nr:glycoside hydrolase family 30 beta sandwich domain-containing protein [Lachnospiraceae bacterium]
MKIITTDEKKKSFWEVEEVQAKAIGCMNQIRIFPEIRRQQMKGFGGAFTESAGYCYSKFDDEVKERFLKAYFSEDGLRYNVGRTHINSCDFALGNYAAVEQTKDGLSEFDMTRANQYVLPLIQDACTVKGEKIELLLSPWSPPSYMKTNGEMNHGGQLKEECYGDWAEYVAVYLEHLRAEGLQLTYLTVQNEPAAVQTWDSCIYSAKEEMVLVRDFLAPTLAAHGLGDIKILVWDHNKEIIYDRAKESLSDEKARGFIYGVAMHWYTGDHFEQLDLVKEAFPEKEIFFTEGCVEYSRFVDSNEVKKAEMYAHDMIGNFTHQVSAFFDWNLLLDAKGGPNHVGNFCAAPIMCTESEKDFEKRLSYYYIGHFSRYIEKGAYAVACSRYCSEIETAAFINPSGEVVVVLLNRQDKAIETSVGIDGMGTDLVLKGHTITTLIF